MSGPAERPTVVFVTALELEADAVSAHLAEVHWTEHPDFSQYREGLFRHGEVAWRVVVVEANLGNEAAAVATTRALDFFRPTAAFFVGVAGGLKDVAIGDVVVATDVLGFEYGKDDKTFLPRGTSAASAHRLTQLAKRVRTERKWHSRRPGSEEAKVRLAPIAAGSKVVASSKSRSAVLLREIYSQAVAVEMEGLGFLAAARQSPGTDAVVVRGISDLLDGKDAADASGSQPRAAANAAAFCFEMVAHLMESWEHKNVQRSTFSDSDIERGTQFPAPGDLRSSLPATQEFFRSLPSSAGHTNHPFPTWSAIGRADSVWRVASTNGVLTLEPFSPETRVSERFDNSPSVAVSADGRGAASLVNERLNIAWINRVEIQLWAWPGPFMLDACSDARVLAAAMSGTEGLRCLVSTSIETLLVRVLQGVRPEVSLLTSEPSSAAVVVRNRIATVDPSGRVRDAWLEHILGVRSVLAIDSVRFGTKTIVAAVANGRTGTPWLIVAGFHEGCIWRPVPVGTDEVVLVRTLQPAESLMVITSASGTASWHRVADDPEPVGISGE